MSPDPFRPQKELTGPRDLSVAGKRRALALRRRPYFLVFFVVFLAFFFLATFFFADFGQQAIVLSSF